MLRCSRLSFTYEDADGPSLRDVSCRMDQGRLTVVTGRSGCGKTTLSRIINGLIPELYEGDLEGECLVGGQPTTARPIYRLSEEVGSVFQNPKTQFFTTDVPSELAFPLENTGVEPDAIQERMDQVADLFGITRLLDRGIFSLSGGEKQMIAIASSCMLNPRILVLDEPSGNLDVQAVASLSRILERLKDLGLTLVVIEHRLYYLDGLADDFLILEDGRLVDHLDPATMRGLDRESRQRMGLRALHLEANPTGPDTGAESRETVGIKADRDRTGAEPDLLRVRNLTYSYQRGQAPALNVDNLTLSSNEITGIIGRNGAGKSTFANILTGLLKSGGQAHFTLNGVEETSRDRIDNSYMVFQDVNYQLFSETVEGEMLLGARRTGLFEEVARNLDLEHLLKRHPNTLSGGEKQRVAIAAAILSGKRLVVLDEPTSGLDLLHMNQVTEMIRYMRSLGVMVVVISHDQEFLEQTCQRFITFREGRPVRDSPELGDLLQAL